MTKKLLHPTALFLLLFAFIIWSCGDDDDASPATAGTPQSLIPKKGITAKIDGVQKNFRYPVVERESGYVYLGGVVYIDSIEQIIMSFRADRLPGTYVLEDTAVNTLDNIILMIYTDRDSNSLFAERGELEIITNDTVENEVVGRFNFSALALYSSKRVQVNDGEFNITY